MTIANAYHVKQKQGTPCPGGGAVMGDGSAVAFRMRSCSMKCRPRMGQTA